MSESGTEASGSRCVQAGQRRMHDHVRCHAIMSCKAETQYARRCCGPLADLCRTPALCLRTTAFPALAAAASLATTPTRARSMLCRRGGSCAATAARGQDSITWFNSLC
jgi:hypothetical protein